MSNPKSTTATATTIAIIGIWFFLISACGAPLSPAESLNALSDAENTHQSAQISSATSATATSIVSPSDTPTPTHVPSAAPTATSTEEPTPTPRPALLPAPIYFIYPSRGTDQIWRLELDGLSLTQISNEPTGVSGLDVSPKDGRLAYTSGNKLYLTDAQAQNRKLLFESDSQPTNWQLDESWLFTQTIRQPHWSPDGASIAVSMNGILIIDPKDGSSHKLIDNYIPAPAEIAQIMVYEPGEWAPNGEYMLSKLRYYAGHSWTTLPVQGGPSGTSFAWDIPDVIWSKDNLHMYVGEWGARGLWMAEAFSGEEQVLSAAFDPELVAGWPTQNQIGEIFFFMGGGYGYAKNDTPAPLMMYKVSNDNVLNPESLGNERYSPRQVLWAPDATFAVVYDQVGQLILVPADKRAAIALIQLEGGPARDFSWGLPGAGKWLLPPHEGFEATPVAHVDCPGTPASNLVVGDLAHVTYTDGRRLRVRSSAEITDGNILKELIEGTRLQIIGGPECVNLSEGDQTYVFWQIFIPDYGIEGWAAEGAVEGDLDVYYIARWP